MYISLNYSYFFSSNDLKKKWKKKKLSKHSKKRKEINIERKIIASANFCANKFLHVEETDDYMLGYCKKKISNLMKIKSLPNVGRSSSTKSVLTVFDKLFYNVNEADNQLSQIDGNTDISGEDKNIPSCLYGVKCEVNELITWINFLRGFINI